MHYVEFKTGEKEYKLRLTASAVVGIEKKLNDNPLNVLMKMQKEELPKIGDLLIILHGALQPYEHGTTMEKTFEIYDEYVDSGKTFTDLLTELIEVFKVSGFFKEAPAEGKKVKK